MVHGEQRRRWPISMTIIRINANVTVDWHPGKPIKKLRELVRRRVKAAATYARTELIRTISQGKTRTQGPSMPGQPPHIDTGALRNSIHIVMNPKGDGAVVGTLIPYGKHLEVGTRFMAPRPWVRPTFDRIRPALIAIVNGRTP